MIHNCIADIMKTNFESAFGRRVNPAEYQSWGNSCQHVRNVLDIKKNVNINIRMNKI